MRVRKADELTLQMGHNVSRLPYPLSHDTEAQAELNEARHARALKALSPSDVLATVDDLTAQIPDARRHPLYDLVAHCLRYGGTDRSGKRPAYERDGGGVV